MSVAVQLSAGVWLTAGEFLEIGAIVSHWLTKDFIFLLLTTLQNDRT